MNHNRIIKKQNRMINNQNRIINKQNRIINNYNRIINNLNRIIHNQNRNINSLRFIIGYMYGSDFKYFKQNLINKIFRYNLRINPSTDT